MHKGRICMTHWLSFAKSVALPFLVTNFVKTMQISSVIKELFLQQSTVQWREHRNLICLCVSCAWMQAVVFVSHCRRQPDFRLALWSVCPPGNWVLPFLLSGIPDFHFILFCERSVPNNFQSVVMLLRSVILLLCFTRVRKESHISTVCLVENKEWLGCSRIKEVLPSWREVFTTWWHSLFNLTNLRSPLCVGWIFWLPWCMLSAVLTRAS